MLDTRPLLQLTDFPNLLRKSVETLQVNLGYTCNQQCVHCHVNAGPQRKEVMTWETMQTVLDFLCLSDVSSLDLTGGAPELNPHFRRLVTHARKLGTRVIDRCNLTILEEPDQQGLGEFLATQQVEVIASLPCYLQENVDRQRGKGVFAKSLSAIQRLNRLGYGKPDTGLVLNLVYNPAGPVLPPPQPVLEMDYRKQLGEKYGVVFTRLLTLTNMPIQRFGSTLLSKGEFNNYLDLLRNAYQPCNLDSVMCRSLISVDWRGVVYDCDFNQMLDMPLVMDKRPRIHLRELLGRELAGRPINVGEHCYGCTAGQGSSCGGALS